MGLDVAGIEHGDRPAHRRGQARALGDEGPGRRPRARGEPACVDEAEVMDGEGLEEEQDAARSAAGDELREDEPSASPLVEADEQADDAEHGLELPVPVGGGGA